MAFMKFPSGEFMVVGPIPKDAEYKTVNDEKNNHLYEAYRKLAEKEPNVLFGGRLGQYKYYDMDKVVQAALTMAEEITTVQGK